MPRDKERPEDARMKNIHSVFTFPCRDVILFVLAVNSEPCFLFFCIRSYMLVFPCLPVFNLALAYSY